MGFCALSDSVIIWGSPLVPAYTPSWALTHTLQPACAANPAWCSWRQGDARYHFFFFQTVNDSSSLLHRTSDVVPNRLRKLHRRQCVCVRVCVCLHSQLQLEPPLEQPYWFLVHTAVTGLECRAGGEEGGGAAGGNNPGGLKARLKRRCIGVYVHVCSTYSQFAEICPCLLKKNSTKNPQAEQFPNLMKQQSSQVSDPPPTHGLMFDALSMLGLHTGADRKIFLFC